MFLNKIRIAVLFTFFLLSSATHAQKFKVVLDPGHGGKDFGATRNSYVEKKIVLDVALRVGEILSRDKSIEVIYTRKTDVFIELRRRSEIANRSKADIFVSIHANAHSSSEPSGTETFVMGQSKTASNLEVAKKENAVITLEDDYKTSYAGFDPNKPESLIGLTLVQEQYIAQSIELASKVQAKFTNDLKRKNRGVKQGPFWVLHGAFMPSILIELGFVSNPEEGAYVNSEEGKQELARSIANAILDYKKQYYSASGASAREEIAETSEVAKTKREPVKAKEEPAKTSSIDVSGPEKETKEGVVFMVQVASGSKEIAVKPSNFKGLKNIKAVKEGSLFKYYYNQTPDINRARKALEEAKKYYPSSFLVAFKDGKKISVEEALK